MARRPTPGQDAEIWATVLNTHLAVSIDDEGALRPEAVSTAIAGTHYTAGETDTLLAAEVDAINARREAYPLYSGQVINTFTHGVGRLGSAVTISIPSGQIRAAILYLGQAATVDAIGIRIGTVSAAGGVVRLGLGTWDFGTKQATGVIDLGTVPATVVGPQTLAISETVGPGWIALLACPSLDTGVRGIDSALGYSYDTTNERTIASPAQTGSAYGAFGTTESFNADSNYAPSTWLEIA